jgi:hypothetical protein
MRFVATLQPIIPLPLSAHWTVIARWTLPFLAQPNVASTDGTTFGIGDLNSQQLRTSVQLLFSQRSK